MKRIFALTSAILLAFSQFATPAFAETFSLNMDAPAVSSSIGDEVAQRIKKKITSGAYFVLGIENKLKSSAEELSILRDNVRALERHISESQVQIEDLDSQLQNLDELTEKNKEKIQLVKLQVARYENRITLLKVERQRRTDDLKKNGEALQQMLTAYYLQANSLYDFEDSSPRLLAFLSDDETTGKVLQTSEYLAFLQQAGHELAGTMLEAQDAVDETQEKIELQEDALHGLQNLLEREQRALRDAQESKERLIEETKGKQLIYETLLELSRKEEASVFVQVQRLRENYAFFQQKLDELKKNPDAFEVSEESDFLDDLDLLSSERETPLAWPVSPSLGISAFFHDEAYHRSLGVPHNAIDIRITQGSRVHAAADGVVTKAIDNGFGYSYIIIAHPDKLLTLYGHISEILVSEGEIVSEGQTIGLSGGIPGTKGAGWLTTGAHLHFEVFKNWQHVDPLEYLPLELVPVASLPEKYIKKAIGEEEVKVKRE